MCSGSPWLLGFLFPRLLILGRCLLTLVRLRWGRRQLNPSVILGSRWIPGWPRKSQEVGRLSLADGLQLSFKKSTSPSRVRLLARGGRSSWEPWDISGRWVPNGAACRPGASPSRCRVGAISWICDLTPRQSRSGCSRGRGRTPKAPAGGAR